MYKINNHIIARRSYSLLGAMYSLSIEGASNGLCPKEIQKGSLGHFAKATLILILFFA